MQYETYHSDNGLLMARPTDSLLAHLERPAVFGAFDEFCQMRDWPTHPGRAPLYLSGCTNPGTVAAAQTQARLGLLAQPGNSVHLQGPNYHRWAIDNGVFGKAKADKPWTDDDTEEYLEYLARVVKEVDTSRVLFATAPDVLQFVDGKPIGDPEDSWERSRKIFPRIRALGLPVALVAQDGVTEFMRISDWNRFDALFLGGSDAFKLGPEAKKIAHSAWLFGKWVHMGRVNSLKRLKRAKEIGCNSADGTFIGFGPDKNLPKVLGWLEETRPQPLVPLQMRPVAA